MNREIKFEYIFKMPHTEKLLKRIFTIEELEEFEMETFLLETDNIIVSRRQYTGRKDKTAKRFMRVIFIKHKMLISAL